MVRVAINGFGRIGRMVFRAAFYDPKVEIVAINDLTDTKMLACLLKRDSVHGEFKEDVQAMDHMLNIGGKKIPVSAERDPAKLPWKKTGVDVVVESTGFFVDPSKGIAHIKAGAKKVLISAPCKCKGGKCEPHFTIVKGVNEHDYDSSKYNIVSNASCTTNCAAPVLKVMYDNFGIKKAFLTTTHAYTSTQKLIDGPAKDARRSRAAAINIIPTTTGAAKAVGVVIPALAGKMDGVALRVPVPTGSMTDFSIITDKPVTVKEINKLFKSVSGNELKGIIQYNEDPLVSTDIIGNPHSAIFDADFTKVIEGTFVKIMAWYDNEWGYSNRMVDVLKML